jgi:hypothetical protein
MTPCWEMLKQKTGIANPSGYWSMRSMDVTPYKNFYTPELATTIYNFYKEDFDVLGYSKDL